MSTVFESFDKFDQTSQIRVIKPSGGFFLLRDGDRWGRLSVLRLGRKQRVVNDNGSGGDVDWFGWVELKCDCGKTVDFWANEFLGKRKMKDCGCGIAADDHGYVVVGVSLPIESRKAVNDWRQSRGLSFSRAIVELIRKGIKAV